MRRIKLAVLISGTGSTLENLCEKSKSGELSADVSVVVSTRANVLGVERAKKRGIPTCVIHPKKFPNLQAFSDAVFEALTPYAPDLVVMAGFMSKLRIATAYADRVINVHPALLPSFGGQGMYGHHVHEAVLKHGCKVSGCTVHFVDNEYDSGPIVAQQPVDVLDDDTVESLAARVQAAERSLYPAAIQWFAEGRLKLQGTRVRVLKAL
jgi:phosphoribosylglycinamide formyltransferase 1